MNLVPSSSSFRLRPSTSQSKFALVGGFLLCVMPAMLPAQSVKYEGSQPPVNFGSANICTPGLTTPAPCTVTLTLDYSVTAGGTLGTPQVLTTGAPNLDFTLANGSTCTGVVMAGSSCKVNVTFSPLYAGARYGAVQITDSHEKVLTTTLVDGSGVGPQVDFLPGTESVITSSKPGPRGYPTMASGMAVDGYGNVYVGDANNNRILKETPSGNGYTESTVVAGLDYGGIAVDSSGNLYIAVWGSDYVLKETLSAGGYIESTIGNGMKGPNGVAVDASGNVYIADSYNGRLLMETFSAGSYTQTDILDCGVPGEQSCPSAVAVDASGNLYVTAYDSSQILKLTPSPNGYTQSTIDSDLFWPSAIAIDGRGDLYIADTLNSRAVKETLSAGSYTQSTVTSSALNWPWGIAVDWKGNVYIADSYNERALKEDLFDPPSLTFGVVSVESIGVENIGNATLTGSGGLSNTTDFSQVAGSGTPPDCILAALSLAPGAECNISLDFKPQSSGTATGTLTLSDNSLNGNPATQKISLTGPGPIAQISTTYLSFGTVPFGTSTTLPVTVTNIGGGVLTVTPSISGYSSPAPGKYSYSIAGSTCGAGVSAGNSCTLQVKFSPTSIATHTDLLTLETNAPANPTVNLHGGASGLSILGGVSGASIQFGSVASGSTEVLPLTVTNVGLPGTVTVGTAITVRATTRSTTTYTVLTTSENTCLAGIAAGQSCTLPVEFAPTTSGTHDDLLTLTPSAGGGQTTVWLLGATP
jgi:sugar lactone lactonase YvrE